jgi:hypothetical protein
MIKRGGSSTRTWKAVERRQIALAPAVTPVNAVPCGYQITGTTFQQKIIPLILVSAIKIKSFT